PNKVLRMAIVSSLGLNGLLLIFMTHSWWNFQLHRTRRIDCPTFPGAWLFIE
ncbi:MAG: hypothetical protein ACI9FD_004594, partial [Gammaproteobacteria bacterium]